MAVLTGLGINYNYNGTGANPSVDIPLLAGLGFKTIRLLACSFTSPSQISAWNDILDICLQYDFEKITIGISKGANTMTSSNWSTYAGVVQTQAAYIAGLSDSRIEYQIGNELSLGHDGSITDAQIRTNLRTLGNACKTANPGLITSYSDTTYLGTEITNWFSEGISGIDKIHFNLYGRRAYFAKCANQVVSLFGSDGGVTEWGTNIGYGEYEDEVEYREEIAARLKILVDSGVEEFNFYNFMNADDDTWGAKLTNGESRYIWPLLIGAHGITM